MVDYKGNLLVKKSVDLLNAKNGFIVDKNEEKCLPIVTEILETPFSIKVPLEAVAILADDVVNDFITQSIKQLVILHGFNDFSEQAINLLQRYTIAQCNKFALQYRISETRRKEKLDTAFKSSAQHLLCSNYITEPGMLQKHVQQYPDNAEYRAKFIKELVECNDGADKNQSTSEEPKRAKKRKRIGEIMIIHETSPHPSPNTTIPPWLSKKEVDVVTLNDSASECMSVPTEIASEFKSTDEKRASSILVEEKPSDQGSNSKNSPIERDLNPASKRPCKPRKSTQKNKSKIPNEFWERMENATEIHAPSPLTTSKPKRHSRK